ncbi:MAG: ribonuclease P protein component [Proteobacteria bacterium]|nr:ribonuclease P protein component [Pseudomonadota bacterium]
MQPSESISRLQPSREKPLGFSRDKRLLTGKAYKQVFDQARRVGNPYWTVYGWRHKEAKAELGLAIAKKTLRRAHERNRLKRLARETFRHMHTDLLGVSVVVMAGKSAQSADNATLVAHLIKLFNLFTVRRSVGSIAQSSQQTQSQSLIS